MIATVNSGWCLNGAAGYHDPQAVGGKARSREQYGISNAAWLPEHIFADVVHHVVDMYHALPMDVGDGINGIPTLDDQAREATRRNVVLFHIGRWLYNEHGVIHAYDSEDPTPCVNDILSRVRIERTAV